VEEGAVAILTEAVEVVVAGRDVLVQPELEDRDVRVSD
jgi:hypothetical protein